MSVTPRGRIIAALAQRVSSGLHLGLLRYGERLPSTRQIAREFSVDPRVALAAYQALERRGIVALRTRSGIHVADPQRGDVSAPSPRDAWLVDVLAEAIGHGIPASELGETLNRSLETLRLRATVLECNDDQLFSVSNELKHDYGLDVTPVDIDSMKGVLTPEARRTDCVITTVPHADIARRLAQDLGVPALILSMCDDLFGEVRRLLPVSPVYFVLSDTRFEAKLRRIFAEDDAAKHLRTLVHGRDDLSEVPQWAPTYLTGLTRQNVEVMPLLERVIPETSVFSQASAREVLEFIVRANSAAALTRPPLERPGSARKIG